jgi:hypothetical protein
VKENLTKWIKGLREKREEEKTGSMKISLRSIYLFRRIIDISF